jgi:hypothetical protein
MVEKNNGKNTKKDNNSAQKNVNKINSDKFTPRALGVAFIYVAFASLFGGLLLQSLSWTMFGPAENISETMIKISENTQTMRLSITVFLLEVVGMVLLAVLLFTFLKKQNKNIARWAYGLWIIQAAMLAARQIMAFLLLYISQEFVQAGAPDSSYFQTLGGLFYESIQFVYNAQMVFYCVGGFLFYYLFLRSRYIPRALSLWGLIAVSVAFIGELFVLLGYEVSLIVFLPILPFELSIGIWLAVKGIR